MMDLHVAVLSYLRDQQAKRASMTTARRLTEEAVREVGLEFAQFTLDQLAAHLPSEPEFRTAVMTALQTTHPNIGDEASDIADTVLHALAEAVARIDLRSERRTG